MSEPLVQYDPMVTDDQPLLSYHMWIDTKQGHKHHWAVLRKTGNMYTTWVLGVQLMDNDLDAMMKRIALIVFNTIQALD